MPKVHHIKSARQDYPENGIKKGDSYYKWSLKTGPKSGQIFRSKTYPKPAQLTSSPFMQQFFGIEEDIANLAFYDAEDLAVSLDDIISQIEQLRDNTQDSLDNIPDNLREGHVAQLLQERIDALDNWVSELQNIDTDFQFDEEEPSDSATDEEHNQWLERRREAELDFVQGAIGEIQSVGVEMP